VLEPAVEPRKVFVGHERVARYALLAAQIEQVVLDCDERLAHVVGERFA